MVPSASPSDSEFALLEHLVSPPRAARYLHALKGDRSKALLAYKANARLSASLMLTIGMFEVILRNHIDQHYQQQFAGAHPDGWIWAAAQPGGMFDTPSCRRSCRAILELGRSLGTTRTHDRLLAGMTFGFWKYLFAGNQFQAAGSTLLQAFPHRPPRTSQAVIYNKLDRLNCIRNRVAHHEPVCFNGQGVLSSHYVRSHVADIAELLAWMGKKPPRTMLGVPSVAAYAHKMDQIAA